MIANYKRNNRHALTLIEMLIVVCLISIISLAVYKAFSNGIAVWRRSNAVVIEQDIVILFDKIASDLQNAYHYSLMKVDGTSSSFSFPSIVWVLADEKKDSSPEEHIFQMGKVEYFYQALEGKFYRRQANYAQALNNQFQEPQLLARSLNNVNFRYFYAKGLEEIPREQTLGVLPSGIEIEIQFTDQHGQRTLKKFRRIRSGICLRRRSRHQELL